MAVKTARRPSRGPPGPRRPPASSGLDARSTTTSSPLARRSAVPDPKTRRSPPNKSPPAAETSQEASTREKLQFTGHPSHPLGAHVQNDALFAQMQPAAPQPTSCREKLQFLRRMGRPGWYPIGWWRPWGGATGLSLRHAPAPPAHRRAAATRLSLSLCTGYLESVWPV